MASYTDIIPQFNPYIQQLPVEAMVQVGMEKQKRYDEGVQRLQTQIDNIAGIQVLRPQDKAYLQSKVNQLGNDLRSVAAGDFSNFQLVNSVGGMIGQVGKDRFVQAAVQSKAWHDQQLALMEEDRKKGTLDPSNKENYLKKLNSYYGAGIQDENGNPIKFSGDYVPFFDVWKFAKDTFDAIKPDGMSWDQVYETDASGKPKIDPATGKPIYSPVMIRREQEGISSKRVKDTLNQIFSDGRVSQQLDITGEYTYRGLDGVDLRARLGSQKESITATYQDMIDQLNVQKNLAKGAEKDEIQAQIDKLKNALIDVDDNYSQLEKAAYNNPDYVRGYLYKNDVKERYTSMFGWSKTKTLTENNPGWQANFNLKKEANEQTRWEKRLAFDEKWNLLNYEQKERLAKKGRIAADGTPIPGGGGGATGEGFTQADQPSDIDVVYQLESDYTKAASEFTNTGDNFIWEMAFANNPDNKRKMDDLMSKGNTKDQAISILLQNNANQNKQSLDEYLASFASYAEREFNKRDQNKIAPELRDAYSAYKNSKRNFETISAVKKRIDDATEANLGSSANRVALTTDLKPQKVKLYGKEYTLTPDDMYDLAVYLRGNQSSLGFLNDEGARKAAKSAEERIRARGKEPLLEVVLRQNVTSGGPLGLITVATRTLGTPSRLWRNVSDGVRSRISGDTEDDVDLSQVMSVYNKIDNDDFEKGMTRKAEIIKNLYGIKPNVQSSLLTGDAETDRGTKQILGVMAGEYISGQKQNLSSDIDKFAEAINVEGVSIQTKVRMDAENNPVVELVAFKEGKRQGGMTVQPDEAERLGVDVNSLYEPRQIALLRNYMNTKGNQTSSADPTDKNTYINGDAYLEKSDFIGLRGTPYDAKANFKYSNGLYYGYLYITDGVNRKVYNAPGAANLTDVYTNLIQNTTPAFAQAILTQQ